MNEKIGRSCSSGQDVSSFVCFQAAPLAMPSIKVASDKKRYRSSHQGVEVLPKHTPGSTTMASGKVCRDNVDRLCYMLDFDSNSFNCSSAKIQLRELDALFDSNENTTTSFVISTPSICPNAAVSGVIEWVRVFKPSFRHCRNVNVVCGEKIEKFNFFWQD